jgi:hypothetical protein
MNAGSMVFGRGDRVAGWGRLVADADGDWLDLARTATPEFFGEIRPRSRRSVRLVGADFSAIPTEFGPNNAIPGTATVTGIWLEDSIQVQSQSPDGPRHEDSPVFRSPPCQPPPGGWPHVEPDENLEYDLGDLENSGAAVTIAMFRPSPSQAVLVIGASDVRTVEAALRPQLPDRLCVVPSRWTRAELDDVISHLRSRWQDWAIDRINQHIDEHAQPSIEGELLRVTAEVADWANTLPGSLLRLVPSLVPIP